MCIYLLFRDLSGLFILKWVPGLVFTQRVFIQLPSSVFSYILLYNIPDMLWYVSGILLLRCIWFNKPKEQKIYIICFYIIGALFEITQVFPSIPGTFDFLDLLFMGIGALVEAVVYYKFTTRPKSQCEPLI